MSTQQIEDHRYFEKPVTAAELRVAILELENKFFEKFAQIDNKLINMKYWFIIGFIILISKEQIPLLLNLLKFGK